jgi:hypothetical protein
LRAIADAQEGRLSLIAGPAPRGCRLAHLPALRLIRGQLRPRLGLLARLLPDGLPRHVPRAAAPGAVAFPA